MDTTTDLLAELADSLMEGDIARPGSVGSGELGLLVCHQLVDDIEDQGFLVKPTMLPLMTHDDRDIAESRVMWSTLVVEDPSHGREFNLHIRLELAMDSGSYSFKIWAGMGDHGSSKDVSVFAGSGLQNWNGVHADSGDFEWQWSRKGDGLTKGRVYENFQAFSLSFAAHLSQELSA